MCFYSFLKTEHSLYSVTIINKTTKGGAFDMHPPLLVKLSAVECRTDLRDPLVVLDGVEAGKRDYFV